MTDELKSILATMNIPDRRKNDILWLGRNLPIQNSNHPKLNRAMELINIEGKILIQEMMSAVSKFSDIENFPHLKGD